MEELIIHYAQKIKNFEYEAGESFTDYFMDDEVFKTSWAFWLVGKGYIERGNAIVNEINKRGGPNGWSDQEFCFNVHTAPLKLIEDYKDDYACGLVPIEITIGSEYDKALEKDYRLWAEFLLSTDRYKTPFLKFLLEYDADKN